MKGHRRERHHIMMNTRTLDRRRDPTILGDSRHSWASCGGRLPHETIDPTMVVGGTLLTQRVMAWQDAGTFSTVRFWMYRNKRGEAMDPRLNSSQRNVVNKLTFICGSLRCRRMGKLLTELEVLVKVAFCWRRLVRRSDLQNTGFDV